MTLPAIDYLPIIDKVSNDFSNLYKTSLTLLAKVLFCYSDNW